MIELVAGGLTADSSVEFYLMAWAATTGGLWFLFEKAEGTLSDESRARIAGWLDSADPKQAIDSIPTQFALLFDRLFGERHWSWKCFNRSCVASVVSVFAVAALLATTGWHDGAWIFDVYASPFGALNAALALVAIALPLNFLPDFASLLETRWAVRFASGSIGLMMILVADVAATAAISLFGIYIALGLLLVGGTGMALGPVASELPTALFRALVGPPAVPPSQTVATFVRDIGYVVRISFLSAFFTSVWLWLYALSVPFSRLLLRMNSGVGFLLRVTDVERQPFRSMGFVSVIIASGLFALGLPLVLV